jgi:hypothetical protein
MILSPDLPRSVTNCAEAESLKPKGCYLPGYLDILRAMPNGSTASTALTAVPKLSVMTADG